MQAQLGDFQLEEVDGRSRQRSVATAVANPELKGGVVKNLFIGKNYRKEWRQPVQAPVFHFATDLGGAKPKEEGGGRQTRSLEIEDAAGNKWVLRSVRKYPENVVIPALQGTIAEKIVADGISASYPYSVLSVGTLAKAAGIPFFSNTLVYLGDDPALGKFRDRYKNGLYFLELRSLDTTAEKQKTYNTEDVIPKLQESVNNGVLQREVLKARLLDNFIMDFDRHAGQWEWVKLDSAARTYYYPVAKDRDQAFFRARGLLPRLARLLQPTLGSLQGFRAEAANIRTFNFVPRDFDRSFLTDLDEQDWRTEINRFLAEVTDTVVEDAFRRQPKALVPYHLDKLIQTLKEKRRHFTDDMLDYYRFLSRLVSVTGSNEEELFTITTHTDGTTEVQVAPLDSSGRAGSVVYQRRFLPQVTKEIRLYGLEGNDRFVLRGEKNQLTIRLIGGPGADQFTNEGIEAKALVYDALFEENTLRGPGLKNKLSNDPLVNEYQRLGMQYPIHLPGPGVELTREGGLFLGLTYKIITPGFRKAPYAAMHSFYAARAIQSSAYHFRYNADFIGIAKNTNLLLRTEAYLPTVRSYFYGYGNNTVNTGETDRFRYLASYQKIDGALLVSYQPLNWLQFRAGPVVQYVKLDQLRNKARYISRFFPQDGNQLYKGQWYGGAEVGVVADRRNHPVFTTRGMNVNLYARRLYRLDVRSEAYNLVGGQASFFTDFLWNRVLVLATSFGADRNFGRFDFPLAQYLGFRQNLRGYRFQRFAGRARAYNNTELRINLGVRNFYLFKGPVGLLGFHDIGRVWVNWETSSTWHRGYGGGVWLAPFGKVVVIGTAAFSKEEKGWLQVSFGFGF